MMQFKIGKVYTDPNEKNLFRFVGVNKNGSLVFKPINETAYIYYKPYNKDDEERDPMCKEGYIGFLVGLFLKEHNEKGI